MIAPLLAVLCVACAVLLGERLARWATADDSYDPDDGRV